MSTIASDTFAGDALAAADIAGGVWSVPAANKGHVRISLANTDRSNPHTFNVAIKRAATGKTIYLSTIGDVLLPGQLAVCPSTAPTLKLSSLDEVHIWGDSQIHYLISGGLES